MVLIFSLPTQRCFSGFGYKWRPLCPFLCLRRGVSLAPIEKLGENDFSLPTQRCFQLAGRVGSLGVLFSAYAEVFPAVPTSSPPESDFSLPTQRCFLDDSQLISRYLLFSAYAEVFPTAASVKEISAAFLCLRRGVSGYRASAVLLNPFSLPTQRCFKTH